MRQALAERLCLNCFDSWLGWQSYQTEAFEPNPYRQDAPYVPSSDIPRRGIWSNCLWFIVDILRPKTRKFYRKPLQRTIRTLYKDPIERWNHIWKALLPTVPYFNNLNNVVVGGLSEECWPPLIREGLAHACFVEDHIFPDECYMSQHSVFALWSQVETRNNINYFRKLKP